MQLSEWDRACLSGAEGEATALAMKILVRMGKISGAARLIDVSSAHIDGGLYHGPAGLDFAARLAGTGETSTQPNSSASQVSCAPSPLPTTAAAAGVGTRGTDRLRASSNAQRMERAQSSRIEAATSRMGLRSSMARFWM
ncbi:MAG: DUF521 domain-containing protein [Actinobacteria bacterium]|nr:DUF521 domain-containing protein [Actinomycetota bacterium]